MYRLPGTLETGELRLPSFQSTGESVHLDLDLDMSQSWVNFCAINLKLLQIVELLVVYNVLCLD